MVEPLFCNGIFAVTGAGSGIGRALAEELAREGARRVVVIDRVAESARSTAARIGPIAIAMPLDVTDPEAVAHLVDGVEHEHGPIDGWFSNAGISRGEGLGEPSDWHLSLNVNLLAHVSAAKVLLPRMEARRCGRFVVTASAAGLLSDLRSAAYTASKHAAVSLTEWLAISVSEGVSIHCVCPEGVTTGMTRHDSIRAAGDTGFISPEAVARATLDGIVRGDFLIFTHPRTSEFEQRRVGDRSRWIAGMRRARQNMLAKDSSISPAAGA